MFTVIMLKIKTIQTMFLVKEAVMDIVSICQAMYRCYCQVFILDIKQT